MTQYMLVATFVPAFIYALNCTISYLHSFALMLFGLESSLPITCLILSIFQI